jgi:hypothetical protein
MVSLEVPAGAAAGFDTGFGAGAVVFVVADVPGAQQALAVEVSHALRFVSYINVGS